MFGPHVAQAGALLHGWNALLAAYAAVQLPLLARLIRERAPLGKLLLSPVLAAPLTVVAGLGMAAVTPLLHGLGMASDGLAQCSIGVALSAALGYTAGRAMVRRESLGVFYLRGAIVTDVTHAASAVDRSRHRSRERRLDGITLAGLPVTAEDEVKHFKLIGATGTGKSTAIHELLGAALGRGDRAVIADPDGGYLRRFYDRERGDVILNPFEPDSARWDLFGEISNDYDVEQLARSLIPDHEGPDRSWRSYARTFFSAVTAQAHAAGSRDVRELYRLLMTAGTAELKTLVAGTPAQPFLEEHNGRMFDSIRSVTSSAVSALDYISRQRCAPLSVRAWVQGSHQAQRTSATDERGVLFMPYRAGQIAALRSTVSAWMRLAIFEAMNREEGGRQRLWFVIDELDALGQIDGLKDALARLRKFGGRCVLGFQSIAQVSSTYGSGEAQTIVENCGNTLILRCSGSEHGGTSQFASRLIGEREVMRVTTSRSRRATEVWPSITHSEHLSIESAVMGSEIEQLPDLAGYLKLASNPAWVRVGLRPVAAARATAAPATARGAGRILTFPRMRSPVAAAGSGRESEHARDGFEP
jgi:type IV secretory pathway TraG/TraD family ATPase VirD4